MGRHLRAEMDVTQFRARTEARNLRSRRLPGTLQFERIEVVGANTDDIQYRRIVS